MRARFKAGVSAYSGTLDGVVFCHLRRENIVFVRRYVYPTITENNHKLGSTTANLHSIQPSDGYKEDMRNYQWRYNTLRENEGKTIRSWVNMYLKLMREMAKRDSSIDLQTLTREEIYQRDLPCITVKRAVEAGLLPVVFDYAHLTREI
ncbi:MAG TPA: hypothetical protein PLX59_03515 [Candidatus Cloacimonadota bacterium]|nr:hypothetical protein [Candidatus Cloacimonadota bacterium]